MSNLQILFVDDDLEFSWLVVAYVRKRLNVPVRVAQSFADATRIIGSEKINLIVCGTEALEVASSLFRFMAEHSPSTDFVLFTSNDEFDRKTLVGANFKGHVPKTKIAALVDLIQRSSS